MDDRRFRYGILEDGADLRLCALVLAVFILDLSQVSIWTGPEKPLADAQRWLTVALQSGYIAANASRLPRIVRPQAPLLALAGFCAASCLWSADPAASLLGTARLLLLAASIVLAQERHGAPAVARIFLVVCSVLLVVNLAAVALPGLSMMPGSRERAFRGFTDHKNTLGAFCGLTLAFVLAAPDKALPRRYLRAFLVCVALATVVLTRSATSFVLCAGMLAAFVLVTLAQRNRLPVMAAALAAFILASAAGLILLGALDPLALIGRDATLTGRSLIWRFVWLYIEQRPWLGYGYRAFPLTDLLRADPRWGTDSFIIGSTHNAYIAIVTEIGFAGLAAYLGWLVAFVLGCFPRRGVADRRLAAMVLGAYLASGLTESIAGLAPGLYFAGLMVAFHCIPGRDAARFSRSASWSGGRRAEGRAG